MVGKNTRQWSAKGRLLNQNMLLPIFRISRAAVRFAGKMQASYDIAASPLSFVRRLSQLAIYAPDFMRLI
jgi:hypothetical protein